MYTRIYSQEEDGLVRMILNEVEIVGFKNKAVIQVITKLSEYEVTDGWVETYNSLTDKKIDTFELKGE